MSTRSRIAIFMLDDYLSVYCHFDGDRVGDSLEKEHNTRKKAEGLISLGDLSYVMPGDVCSYHRDRGDPWELVQPTTSYSKEELIETSCRSGAEYLYIFTDHWERKKL